MTRNYTTLPPTSTGMPDYERGILVTYDVLCTILTISLNAFVIFIIFYKVPIRRYPSSVPVLVASFIGLFHGFGFNLMVSMSLISGDWVGSMRWCEITEVLHKYIVYSIIYCATVVSLEASYVIARPFSYDREGGGAMLGMCLATFLAIFVQIPITICHFFYLKPSEIREKYPDAWDFLEGKPFIYMHRQKICYRYYFHDSFDSQFIGTFVLTANMMAISLVVLSYVVIFVVILQSRRVFGDKTDKGRTKRRAQNKKIARAAIIMTTWTLLPWFPNPILGLVLRFVDSQKFIDLLGYSTFYGILDATNYMYYLVPWIFPLFNLFSNPVVVKAISQSRQQVTRKRPTQYRPTTSSNRTEAITIASVVSSQQHSELQNVQNTRITT